LDGGGRMRWFSLKLWVPVLLVGVVLIVSMPVMHDLPDKGIPTPPSTNWQALIGEVCIGLGSLASIIRGLVELVKLFKRGKKE
jgi:hypothetical protein